MYVVLAWAVSPILQNLLLKIFAILFKLSMASLWKVNKFLAINEEEINRRYFWCLPRYFWCWLSCFQNTSSHQRRDEISVAFIIIMKFMKSFFLIFFLIEINFRSAVVIQGLVLNFIWCLIIVWNSACLYGILFMESKKFWNDASMLLFWSFKVGGQFRSI